MFVLLLLAQSLLEETPKKNRKQQRRLTTRGDNLLSLANSQTCTKFGFPKDSVYLKILYDIIMTIN